VILARDGDEGLEVLLVKRSPMARFMAGVWVFPGGALEHDSPYGADGDAAGDQAHRAAAVRELHEEAGVSLGSSDQELVEFSRWITPAAMKIRFDARFFVARLPADQQPRVDGEECVDLCWLTPHEALEAGRKRELALVFPTIKHLEALAAFGTVAELIEHARGRTVLPVEPRVRLSGDSAQVVLPGEPGYDDPDQAGSGHVGS
jgi:8-oxo-dGTP pyrophosphatase MutT (NUDIX family)